MDFESRFKECKRRMKECCGPYSKLPQDRKYFAELICTMLEKQPNEKDLLLLELFTKYQAVGQKMQAVDEEIKKRPFF